MVIYLGSILFTTRDTGILYFDPVTDSLLPFFSPNLNAPSQPTSILVNGDDLWFGTNGKGVFKLNNNVLSQLDVSKGLVSNLSFSLALDEQGRVWVASDAGMNVINENFEVEQLLNEKKD